MIATVTLNPAVDKTIHASRVVLGMVNRVDDVANFAGGKGINVARVLRQYDYDVKCLGFLGGYCGELIGDAVRKMGAKDVFTTVKNETRTSINIITEDGYITEFLEPGPSIDEGEIKSFLDNYEKEIEDCDIVAISGSAPVGVGPEIYNTLVTIAKDKGKKVLLDASGDNLREGVKAKPFMIKPNLRELEHLMGRRIQGIQDVLVAATSIIDEGVLNVVVSMGSKGILYARQGDTKVEAYYVQAPSIRVVNSVGSGDSAVAAFAMAVSDNLNPEEIIKKCVSISVANALSLENGNISKEKVSEIEKELKLTVPIY